MTEHEIQNAIIRAFGTRAFLRIWRANTGTGIGYEAVRDAIAALMAGRVSAALQILRHARPVTFGVPGQADLTGVLTGGRRLEIEVKSAKGKQSPDQANFQAMIERFGGLYILARSAEDVAAALRAAGYPVSPLTT